MLQDDVDLVLAFEQTLARRAVDREGLVQAEAIAHLAAFEIDLERVAVVLFGAHEDRLDGRFRQRHRQHAVADRVVAEDVGERRRDDDAEAGIEQRPGGMLARRSATEVDAGGENRGAGELRLVQHERRILLPVVEQERAESRFLDALEELFRDDLIGVDVVAPQRRDASAMLPNGCRLPAPGSRIPVIGTPTGARR